MATTNPLRLLHQAIWAMLRANTTLCGVSGLVTLSNQVAYFGTDRVATRDVMTEGKTPEMEVVGTGLKPHLQQTSSGSALTWRFEIRCTSGSELAATIHDIQWEIFRAMEAWQDFLPALLWEGNRFVKVCRPVAAREGLGDSREEIRRARGRRGWVCVWACEVDMDFTTADIALGT